jgi:glutamate-5-semialdehyde dehydrogenase
MVDRLRLTDKIIATMAEGCEQLAAMPDPVGEMTGIKRLPSGTQRRPDAGAAGRVRHDFREPPQRHHRSRLAGHQERQRLHPARRLGSHPVESGVVELVRQALESAGLPATAVQMVETTDRAAVGELITMPAYVDVIIPRGGKGLIERISNEAKVPVIKHLDGNCHTYVDAEFDLEQALIVTENAKTQKYSPCNATESLLVHERAAADFLPRIGEIFAAKGVEMRCDAASKAILADVPGARSRMPRRKTGTPNTWHRSSASKWWR